MDSPRLLLVIVLVVFLFLSPGSRTPSLSQQRELDFSVLEELQSLDVLNTSKYGDLSVHNGRWLNLTGLRQDDGYGWEALPKVQERAKEQLQTILDAFALPHRFKNDTSNRNHTGSENGTEQDTIQKTSSEMNPFSDPDPLYHNLTSILHGKWTRSSIVDGFSQPAINLSALAPRVLYTSNSYDRNISGESGDFQIHLKDKESEGVPYDSDSIKVVKAQVTIKDETSSGDGWEITMFGVHYIRHGSIVLSTTSEKFAGIFALPHFTLSDRSFILAQEALNSSLMTTIRKQESDYDSVKNPWSSSSNSPSDSMFPAPHCEYVAYLQQHPIEDAKLDLEDIEKELRFPTGAPMPNLPSIRMSALLFSPDCGFALESKGPPDSPPQQGLHLNGEKQESYLRFAKRCILAFAAVICAQIYLLLRQMKDTSTPSTRSRVSFYAIAIMALGDGVACMGFMVVSMFIDTAFLPLITTAFLSFLCVSFFGMKFLMDIWTVQAPERQERERDRQRDRDQRNAAANTTMNTAPDTTSNTVTNTASNSASSTAGTTSNGPANSIPTPAPVTSAAGANTLPLPVTARRPDTGATPVILPPDQDIDATIQEGNTTAQITPQTTLGSARREMSALYSKFYFLLLGILFLSVYSTSWPTTLRSLYCNALIITYLSFWIPQIHRNVIRNCRKALRWEFVIGESILRLAPIIYFYAIPDNVLFIENDRNAAYVLVGWVWIQIWALVSQEILGPRFFVPNSWVPPAYDYHPILRENDEEAGATLPIGFSQATADLSSPTSAKPGESKDKGKKIWDCAICTEDIEVPVLPAIGASSSRSGSGDGGGDSSSSSAAVLSSMVFTRRAYMVTPCRHIFHSQCLEGWMRYRLQCPICRESLPPL